MSRADVNDGGFGEAAYCHHRHHPDEHSDDFDTCPHSICTGARRAVPPDPPAERPVQPPTLNDPWGNPCAVCGVKRTVAEGGTVFTVCDDCWDKHGPGAAPAPAAEPKQQTAQEWSDTVANLIWPAPETPQPARITSVYDVLKIGHDFVEDERWMASDSCGHPVRCGQPRDRHERGKERDA